MYPKQAVRLIKDPVKGIFVPLVVLSFATIMIGTIKYAVPTGHIHPDFIYALFWYGRHLLEMVCPTHVLFVQGLCGLRVPRLLPDAHGVV